MMTIVRNAMAEMHMLHEMRCSLPLVLHHLAAATNGFSPFAVLCRAFAWCFAVPLRANLGERGCLVGEK